MAVQAQGVVRALPLFARAGADADGSLPALLLWEGWDERVRAVAVAVAASGLARPVMFAHHEPDPVCSTLDAEVVLDAWRLEAERPGGSRSDPPAGDPELAATALALKLVDVAVGGADTGTPEVLRAGLRRVGARRTISIAYFVALRHGPRAGELFLIADIGVVPLPGEDQLFDIAIESADTWKLATAEDARVAFLGISTKTAAQGAIEGAVRRLRAERPDVVADGELQADAAVCDTIAARKDPDGPIAGKANVLIVPSLEGGNISYKLLQRLGGADVFGITQGFRRPFHDISRGCDAQELLDTALFCAAGARLGVS